MARAFAMFWLLFGAILPNLLGSKAQEGGLSVVTETDQEIPRYETYNVVIKNWVHSGRPGLFMNDGVNMTENGTFYVQEAGVYYVTANLIVETKNADYHYWYWYTRTRTFQGRIYLEGLQGEYIDDDKNIYTYVTMEENEQKNLRISGYVQLEAGWQLSIRFSNGYRWEKTIKVGSTLSIMYVSKLSTFPGVLLRSNYNYLYLKSPSYSANVDSWNEVYEGSAFPMSEDSFMVPYNGLYHVLVNLNIRRYSDIQLKFAIMINNETEAITKTVTLDSGGTNTITLDGILNFVENQTIAVTISDSSQLPVTTSYVYARSTSSFFIFSKGQLSHSIPAISASYKSTTKALSGDKFSPLNQWDVISKPTLNHYSNVKLQNGEFVSSRTGIYQVIIALYLSNCTKASARLSLKTTSAQDYKAVSPDISFTEENEDCYLENSLLLSMGLNDTLKLEVKSDQQYTVLTQTTYQVVFEKRFTLWPAAIYQLVKAFQFQTNSDAVKVHGWSQSKEGDWNDQFFNIYNRESIEIKIPGMYLVSYNLVVKITSGVQAQFVSNIVVDRTLTADGSKCQRGISSPLFTCTTSTLLNLEEKQTLAVQVSMTDKKSGEIITSSRMTIMLIGDIRSYPSFKLRTKPNSKPYVTKAKRTDMQSLTDFTYPSDGFFQSAAMYSNDANIFKTGKDVGFLLLNNLQFDLLSDGSVASVVGSKDNSVEVYSKDHKKSHFSVTSSDLSVNNQFYFNVSGMASSSDLKWKVETGSVVSGIKIGSKPAMTALKAQLIEIPKVSCTSQWAVIKKWKLVMHLNNLANITKKGIQILKSGFYVTSLNFAIKSSKSNAVIQIGIFVDEKVMLTASETNLNGTFSIFLQGVLDLTRNQDIKIKFKCTSKTDISFAKGGGVFAFQVDERQISPGLRLRFSPDYGYDYGIRDFSPSSYISDHSAEEFYQDFMYTNRYGSQATVKRSGLYLVAVVGKADFDEKLELAFFKSVNISDKLTCGIDSSLLYFSDSSNTDKPFSMTAFVSLKKNEKVGLSGRFSYSYWYFRYSSRFYLSVQFVGDIDTSSGVTATLQNDVPFTNGENQKFREKAWMSGKTCGQYTTRNVPAEFGKYKVLYTGYYVVSTNLVLKHKNSGDFVLCFAVDGKSIKDVGGIKDVGCFYSHLHKTNQSSTSTVGGSELLYLEAGKSVSVQVGTNIDVTISSRSSFSAFYLGSSGAMFGFSSVMISKAQARELPSYNYRYSYYHYRYDRDDDYAQYAIEGWKARVPKTKMFFLNGVKLPLKDLFVCPRDGVYMAMVKLHVKGKSDKKSSCEVRLELAVDGEVLDFAYQKKFVGPVETLSFTTTLKLEKWQGVSVRFSRKRTQCEILEIGMGSSLAVVYLGSGKKSFTLWPNIGPHIVESPERNVYVREDKTNLSMLTCRAVGEYPITYQWKTYEDDVVSTSSKLDTRKLNSTAVDVKCVVTMGTLVAESRYVYVHSIDPTVIFSDTYNNRSYDLPESNTTSGRQFQDVLVFGARMKKSGYYYYYWEKRINCSITKGNIDDAFFISDTDYYFGYGDEDDYFKLRARIWKLDREKTPQYKIEIKCVNLEFKDAASAVTTIDVVILDSNDNLPVFDQEIYSKKIPKTIQPGDDIIQVLATDDDINENGKITYSLVYDSDSYIFEIDKDFGVISLSAHEMLTRPYYRLTVEATDQGDPPRSAYVTVALEVQDFPINRTSDHPVFDRPSYIGYIIKDTPVGTIVTAVHAHDPITFDDRNIRYYIFSGDSSLFEVNSKSGVIKTKGAIRKREYHLEIAAEYTHKPGDKPGPHYNITEVKILVKYVDARRPNFVKSHYNVSIREDAKNKSEVVTVQAEYNGKIEYSIPAARGIFVIDKNNGRITITKGLDYETTQVYTFVVRASDAKDKTKSDCTDVTVNVLDVNDNPPVISYYSPKENVSLDLSQGSLPRVIGHVFANDEDHGDNGKIKYYLKNDYDKAFSINRDNGTIYWNKKLRCCNVSYELRVEAKDQGEPPLHDRVTINVHSARHGSGTHSGGTRAPTRAGGHGHGGDAHAHTGGSSSSQKTYIIAGVVGGVVVLSILAGVVYWRRRQRLRNCTSTTMNYISLPSDDDDDLLDTGSEHGNQEQDNNRRLSLISDASDDNLLRNEAHC